MPSASRLTLAHHLDRWDARLRRLGEHLGWPQAWLREFRAYLGDSRLEPAEFWARYAAKRDRAHALLSATMTDDDARAFYRDHDYLLWRQLVHRRHAAWRRVLVTMPRRLGRLLEFGCGIAPVSAWLAPRRPRWQYALEDLPSPHFSYGQWRIAPHAQFRCSRYAHTCTVIVALDVFEHLADPEATARDLVNRLEHGGYLHWNFVDGPPGDLNLATWEQREATCRYLLKELELVWVRDGHTVSRRPWP